VFATVSIAVLLLAALGLLEVIGAGRHRAGSPAWIRHVRAVDEALAARDVAAASHALQQAHVAALSSRHWEGLVAVGDAALRLGAATRDHGPARSQARQAYLTALFRARAARSLDGALRVTEAFAALGDANAAEQSLKIAHDIAASDPDGSGLARVYSLAERLGDHSLEAGILRVEPF